MTNNDIDSPILRPVPLRPFALGSAVEDDDGPSTPSRRGGLKVPGQSPSLSRAQSIVNLTASTLFGIYAPSSSLYYGSDLQAETPRPASPAIEPLQQQRRSSAVTAPPSSASLAPTTISLTLRLALLFFAGSSYGLLISHLHDGGSHPTAFPWTYLALWGLAGVVLGGLLPWIDSVTASQQQKPRPRQQEKGEGEGEQPEEQVTTAGAREAGRTTDWAAVVRGIGAFVGIVFAIVSLPPTLRCPHVIFYFFRHEPTNTQGRVEPNPLFFSANSLGRLPCSFRPRWRL